VLHGDPEAALTARARPSLKERARSARGEPPLPRPSSSGDRQNAVWIIPAVILAAGIAALIALVPRRRCLDKLRHHPAIAALISAAKPNRITNVSLPEGKARPDGAMRAARRAASVFKRVPV
jgi:hypothetical protein